MNWDRIAEARARAQGIFMIAGFAMLMPVLWWIAGPRSIGGIGSSRTTEEGLFALRDLPIAVGIAGVLFGLAWMWRIYKAPTKYEGAHWRYRDR